MKKYHKINTVFKRDPATKNKNLLIGDFSCPEFEYLKNNKWLWSEKVNGTNTRVLFDGDRIRFGGKTDDAQISVHLYDFLNDVFINKLELFKEIFGTDGGVCLYGEGYGKNIGKDGMFYKKDGVEFVLFDINIDGWWLQRENFLDVAQKLSLATVPIVGEGTLGEMISLVEKGYSSRWGDFLAEGIVARPEMDLFTRKGERIITKLKLKDFIKK